jgi:uncharacterized membrane protein YvbJ
MINKKIIIPITILAIIMLILLVIFLPAQKKGEEAENRFSKKIENEKQYLESLTQAQTFLNFPIQHPLKMPNDFNFYKIDYWAGNTIGIYINYINDHGDLLTILETNTPPYSPALGRGQKIKLGSKKIARFWDLAKIYNTNKKILLFDEYQKGKQTIFYTVQSSLTQKEIVSIANSMQKLK